MNTNDTNATATALRLLEGERDRIQAAIKALVGGQGANIPAGTRTVGTRHPRTQAMKDAQAEKMRQYWAGRKAEAAAKGGKRAKRAA